MIAIEYKNELYSEDYLKKILKQDNISKKSVAKFHPCNLNNKQKKCVEAILNGQKFLMELGKKEREGENDSTK